MPENKKMILRVRRLLHRGYKINGISKALSIGRNRTRKLINQIITSKKKGRARISELHSCHHLIMGLVQNGKTIEEIRCRLPIHLQKLHKSSLYRYVKRNCNQHSACFPLPGEIGYLMVHQMDKNESYLFCMLLGYSQYCFSKTFQCCHVHALIGCQMDCFAHLKGVPEKIQVCDFSCLQLQRKDVSLFESVLRNYGVLLEMQQNPDNYWTCRDQVKLLKDHIMACLFMKSSSVMEKWLARQLLHGHNLTVHPQLGGPIKAVFQLHEQPVLKQLPRKIVHKPIITKRKVSNRNCFYFRGKRYVLEEKHEMEIVWVIQYRRIVEVLADNKRVQTFIEK